ncbi:RidA family protein [Brooklawnia sp.]|uniref:RidA family protein n=1 Tax=Brooklawnia sp. TaxID=2699740 RepID=UPI00311D8B05
MAVQRINPISLERSPYYSQATLVPAGASMLYVGGQNAVNASGAWIGLGDEAAQTSQAMKNVLACLNEAGATPSDLVSLEIRVVGGVDLALCQRAASGYLDLKSLPVIGVSIVEQLARKGALVEISAVAAVIDGSDAAWLGRGEIADPAWF